MAELEVAKHGKNVINMAASKEHGLVDKLKEIALEIAIIVFAVSISIWFHSMSEHRHEQKQVRTFLLGLKTDLKRDIAQLTSLAANYRESDAAFRYLGELDPKGTPDAEKFERAYVMTYSNRFFGPVTSRFEGFKSSGKLINIEDEELLNDIMTLYQENHRVIGYSERGWSGQHDKLRSYLDAALESGDSLEQRYRALNTVNGKRLLRNAVTYHQLYQRYEMTAKLSDKIIQRIDALYKDS
ncbi:DUF6090 family protein [Pseudoduganella sp. OTU4001]|uniref:DUF6090 family protein n=1 Tax=Pseudoduganella sp. OTU4001 TaxID=3043854 RepID=UPI00313B09E2